MAISRLDQTKELRLLHAFFGEATLPDCEEVHAAHVPDPYRQMLVHDQHMTVTLERYYGRKVKVLPYRVHHQGDVYGRKLDLVTTPDETVVMTGIMLFNFTFCNDEVREEIISQRTPLGHILIAHGILRKITSETFLRISAHDPLVQRFHLEEPQDAYGRLATIFCDEKPAVDLLEIVRP